MKQRVVAIVGGAVAGSEAASLCAERGALVVVFEQGERAYGKIEDGLPRWHEKLRAKEYGKIDENLSGERVLFVPNTRIGRDISFAQLQEAGFSALILANGAWRDRPLPIEGIDEYVGKGLLYQNSYVYWFNHIHEKDYDGPKYEAVQGAAVVGGGLASIDVVKILSLMTHADAIRAKGIKPDLHQMEIKGLPKYCEMNDIDLDALAIKPPTLYYRRNMEDMPLASFPDNATDEQKAKVRKARTKIMKRVMDRYRVAFEPLCSPKEAIVEDDRLVGIRFQRTQIIDGRVKPVEGETVDVHAPLFISSIGSVPQPIEGVPMRGELYDYADWDTGEVRDLPGVFGLGNVLTGKGNIKDSRLNAKEIARGVLEGFLSMKDMEKALDEAHEVVREAAKPTVEAAMQRPIVDDGPIQKLVHERWEATGYTGSYEAWMSTRRPE